MMTEGESPVVTETVSPASERADKPNKVSLFEIIRDQIVSLESHHCAVIETDEVEAIHKMRVTTRRLQASVDLLMLNHRHSQKDKTERYVRKLKKQLRKWRRSLSRVRNYDVFLMMIEKEIAARRGAHREQYELLKSFLNKHREAQAEKVRSKLADIKIGAIADRLGIEIPAPEGPAEETDGQESASQEPARDGAALEARRVLMDEKRIALRSAQRLEQRVAEFHAFAALVHPTTHPEELHQLRIAAKRVRYLMEILSELGVGHPVRTLTWLRSLQDRIGDWHDLVALEEEIIAIVSQPGFMKDHLAESSRMLMAASQLQKKKEALVSRLFPIKTPMHLETSSQSLIRALRRKASREPDPAQFVNQ